MAPDDENPEKKADENIFDYGDRTMFQLRAQAFAIEEEYGTMMAPPPMPAGADVSPPDVTAEDPIVRLEQKLDAALRMIAVLQHKVESIDATLARALNR
jgi:hypothetical protein